MPNDERKQIIRELEKCMASGQGASNIFMDFLSMSHATLTAMPSHIKAMKETGQMAEDTEEVQKIWEQLRERYQGEYYWTAFSKAFAILLSSTYDYQDLIGDVYMEFGIANKRSGQFFTPFNIAKMMAEIHSESVIRQVHDHIKEAIKGDILSESLLLASVAIKDPDQIEEWFITQIIPSVAGRVKPVTVNDPACGSGVMFLALASSIPAWMTQMGLVQFYGMDIDQTCVMMAQINSMLYGFNGFAIRLMVAAAGVEPETPIEVNVQEWKQDSLI